MTCLRAKVRAVLAAVLVSCQLAALPGQAQVADPGGVNALPRAAEAGEAAPRSEALDYAAWDRLARRAEALLAAGRATTLALERLRAELVDWRAAFLAAQGGNAERIATLRGQIEALGPVPGDGGEEAPGIADRRRDLNAQLARLQAPAIAAEEAHRRADGLIREIDIDLRDRRAAELTRLWPSPLNPANWPAAWDVGALAAASLLRETAARVADPEARRTAIDNLPLILALVALAVALLWRGREWFEEWPNRLRRTASPQGAYAMGFVASLGQIAVPVAGVLALSAAAVKSGLLGPQGTSLAAALPLLGFVVFAARWLGFRAFPHGEPGPDALRLSPEHRRQGRLAATALGVIVGLEAARREVLDAVQTAEAAHAVLAAPGIVLCALLLFRLGQLLRLHLRNDATGGEAAGYRNRLIRILGNGLLAVAVAGPLLAAVGYVGAGLGTVYPAAISAGLVALLFALQGFARNLFAWATGSAGDGREALVPVLAGFLLTLASLPVFALIWGARPSDLTEVLARLGEGFAIGQTRISPGAFLTFAVTFAVGLMLTRLLQGALKASILPRTSLDLGGRNAVVAGVGYTGVFIAALVAIKSAGIDLTGLAFVAGALSVGIGFGLQNIVSNFVSGVILLVERPISEGDWIEVGGVQGTVRAISVRSTRIQTFDRTDVIVPNSDLIAGRVTNWTRFNLTGRLIIPVGVGYGSDTRRVEAILREIAEAQPLAVLDPPPLVTFMGFGADSLNFEIRLILRDINFGLTVRSEVNHQIAERFRAEGIEIPFPQRDLWLRNPEALAARGDAAAASGAPAPPVIQPEDPRT